MRNSAIPLLRPALCGPGLAPTALGAGPRAWPHSLRGSRRQPRGLETPESLRAGSPVQPPLAREEARASSTGGWGPTGRGGERLEHPSKAERTPADWTVSAPKLHGTHAQNLLSYPRSSESTRRAGRHLSTGSPLGPGSRGAGWAAGPPQPPRQLALHLCGTGHAPGAARLPAAWATSG